MSSGQRLDALVKLPQTGKSDVWAAAKRVEVKDTGK